MKDTSNTKVLYVLLKKGKGRHKSNLYSTYKAIKCFFTVADAEEFLAIRGIEDEWEVVPVEIV